MHCSTESEGLGPIKSKTLVVDSHTFSHRTAPEVVKQCPSMRNDVRNSDFLLSSTIGEPQLSGTMVFGCPGIEKMRFMEAFAAKANGFLTNVDLRGDTSILTSVTDYMRELHTASLQGKQSITLREAKDLVRALFGFLIERMVCALIAKRNAEISSAKADSSGRAPVWGFHFMNVDVMLTSKPPHLGLSPHKRIKISEAQRLLLAFFVEELLVQLCTTRVAIKDNRITLNARSTLENCATLDKKAALESLSKWIICFSGISATRDVQRYLESCQLRLSDCSRNFKHAVEHADLPRATFDPQGKGSLTEVESVIGLANEVVRVLERAPLGLARDQIVRAGFGGVCDTLNAGVAFCRFAGNVVPQVINPAYDSMIDRAYKHLTEPMIAAARLLVVVALIVQNHRPCKESEYIDGPKVEVWDLPAWGETGQELYDLGAFLEQFAVAGVIRVQRVRVKSGRGTEQLTKALVREPVYGRTTLPQSALGLVYRVFRPFNLAYVLYQGLLSLDNAILREAARQEPFAALAKPFQPQKQEKSGEEKSEQEKSEEEKSEPKSQRLTNLDPALVELRILIAAELSMAPYDRQGPVGAGFWTALSFVGLARVIGRSSKGPSVSASSLSTSEALSSSDVFSTTALTPRWITASDLSQCTDESYIYFLDDGSLVFFAADSNIVSPKVAAVSPKVSTTSRPSEASSTYLVHARFSTRRTRASLDEVRQQVCAHECRLLNTFSLVSLFLEPFAESPGCPEVYPWESLASSQVKSKADEAGKSSVCEGHGRLAGSIVRLAGEELLQSCALPICELVLWEPRSHLFTSWNCPEAGTLCRSQSGSAQARAKRPKSARIDETAKTDHECLVAVRDSIVALMQDGNKDPVHLEQLKTLESQTIRNLEVLDP